MSKEDYFESVMANDADNIESKKGKKEEMVNTDRKKKSNEDSKVKAKPVYESASSSNKQPSNSNRTEI